MFIRLMIYQMKRLLHKKDTMFWTLCFPILLGTLFYMGFGKTLTEEQTANKIPIAIVEQGEVDTDQDFIKLIDELSQNDENQLFVAKNLKLDEAKKKLKDESISGYYIAGKEVKLIVSKSGIEQSIMKQVLDQYNRVHMVVADLVMNDPTIATNQIELEQIVKSVTAGTEYTKEISLGSGKSNSMLVYFYALIGMLCIYGSLMGTDIVKELEANTSSLGARRNVASASKMVQLLADVAGCFIIHMCEIGIVILYLKRLLNIDFGTHTGYIMLACAFGSMIGIALGTFVSMIIKAGEGVRVAAVLTFSMCCSFLSGLMVGIMPYVIEQHAPIINRINPCMLLVNSFYSLNIYDTMDKYSSCLISMAIITVLLFGGTLIMMRRRKYASI